MKLVVLGANGRTGKHVLEVALEKGMDVTAIVRSAVKRPSIQHDRLRVVVGDPCDPALLKRVLHGQDAVISALGGRRPTKAASAVNVRSADAIVEAAWETGVKRVLVTSTALLFQDQRLMGRILRAMVPNIVRSSNRMERILHSSGLNWTSVRAGFLNDGPADRYVVCKSAPPLNGHSVSRRALARFLVEAVENPDTYRAAFGISNAVESDQVKSRTSGAVSPADPAHLPSS